jgi:hypothetical protein
MTKETSKSRRPPAPQQTEDARTTSKAAAGKPAGRIGFDDRGNAVWEWAVKTGEFVKDSASARLKKLDNPSLSLADDAPTPADVARANPHGTLKGYNPYDSGKLGGKEVPKKKDLRKLGEWLALKRQAERNKRGED